MLRLLLAVVAAVLVAGFLAGALPGRAQGQAALPDGAGKDQVESVCTACHPVTQITRSAGYTEDGWRELTSTMVDLSGNPALRAEITGYLAAHFPPNQRQAAKLLPGEGDVAFKEWQVPTLGQRSRDPIEAADGTIWWAGQWGNLIGKIDPKTGAMTEYPLPEGAMPHTVTLDAAGNVWYTGNKNGTLGKFDPKTEEITVYEMPDPAARDPHSAIFDRAGILWFTLQQSNRIGRLDPASGDVKLVTPPTAGARPYGIKIDKDGNPWVACNGSNCLLKVDPATLELTEVKLPGEGTKVRRLDIAEDGMIWYVNSTLGKLGRYDPASGAITEWDSPSGPKSHPYAIAVIDGTVWYNESGVRPDALVRFDPKTERFQSWAIPSGGVHAGIVRHMRATKDGNLLIHQSSTNRIIRVNLKGAATQ
jgi:virginiamycin B lyase